MNYTKKEKKNLRELAALAYERELVEALEELYANFSQWKKGEIQAFDLQDYIHKFHNGISRELWNVYAAGHNDFAVIQAVAKGVVSEKEVKDVLWIKIKPRADILKDNNLVGE